MKKRLIIAIIMTIATSGAAYGYTKTSLLAAGKWIANDAAADSKEVPASRKQAGIEKQRGKAAAVDKKQSKKAAVDDKQSKKAAVVDQQAPAKKKSWWPFF